MVFSFTFSLTKPEEQTTIETNFKCPIVVLCVHRYNHMPVSRKKDQPQDILGISSERWVSICLILFFFFPISSHFLGKLEGGIFT